MHKIYTFIAILTWVFIVLVSCASKREYPADYKEGFIRDCKTSPGLNEAICTCLLEKIEAKYTLEEISRIEARMRGGENPADYAAFLTKAREECGVK